MGRQKEASPFQLLKDIERRSATHNVILNVDEDLREQAAGIAFRIGKTNFVAEVGDVVEVLTYPDLSRIPRAKRWIKGIANVRGNLLPVLDLRGYLEGSATPLHRRSRILIINKNGVSAGLLVDESFGLRRFFIDERKPVGSDLEPSLAPYVGEHYATENGDWFIFSMSALTEHPEFLKAAG